MMKSLKKVLVITYYWPPMGGGGVQRWLKTTKYIREFGWEPTIFTAENAETSMYDESLLNDIPDEIEVIKSHIWEPFGLYKRLLGKKDEKINPGFLQKRKGNNFLQDFSVWIRGNFFIPDAKKFWKRLAVNKINYYLQDNEIDAIVSTGPPHTTHLIAQNVAKQHNIPWLADFRDPWTNIDFYYQLKLTSWADKKHKRLERKVLQETNKIVTVSKSWAKDFKRISGIEPIVINNGFDPADFEDLGDLKLDKKFSITHVGSLNKDRNPFILWKVLSEIIQENDDFASDLHIKLIGPIDVTVNEELERKQLLSHTTLIESLPHKEVLNHMIQSQTLLLPLNDVPNIDGVIPGKMYEYFGAKRPIICIGKEGGDAAEIINETKTGVVVGFSDDKKLKQELLRMYNSYTNNNLQVDSQNYTQYSRRTLASKFANVLDTMID